jgi:3-oxoacyl-[acyl-carrier protein] reductase
MQTKIASHAVGCLITIAQFVIIEYQTGITANAIAPALSGTDMVISNPSASPALIPMGHFGSVDDVASLRFCIFG